MSERFDTLSLPANPERVMEGLRDTGYSFNTAIADIVDNSIAANASQVDITIQQNAGGKIYVYIADNGCGMNKLELENAMTYGSKKRSDPSSLGKFGLGLKTSSTAFCRKFSVVSRGSEGAVRKLQWDIDYVADQGKWLVKILEPSIDDMDLLDEVAGESGTGTLVIWENVDRLLKKDYKMPKAEKNAISKIIESLRKHLGMVYQRFIDISYADVQNVKISLNGREISAWDPFCINSGADLAIDEKYKITTDDNDNTSGFSLKAYILPRREDFPSRNEMEEANISNDFQGIYIYRENRLIHYGDWLGMYTREPHFSLLRVDFSFDHTLDEFFNVDIKKSRINLATEILEELKKRLQPCRREAERRYRTGETKRITSKPTDAHASSNMNVDEKASGIEEAKVIATGDNDVTITNEHGTFNHKISVFTPNDKDKCRIVPVASIESGALWEPCLSDGKQAVQINMSHPYYQKIYYPILSNHVTVIGMDSLLWALGAAEFSTYDDKVKEYYEDIRHKTSYALKKLVADLPDPVIDEEVDTDE